MTLDCFLGRRGFSRYLYGFQNQLEHLLEEYIPFDIIFYSISHFLQCNRYEIWLEGRGFVPASPSSVSTIEPTNRCLVSKLTGSCNKCFKEPAGQYRKFLKPSRVPILAMLPEAELNSDNTRVSFPAEALRILISDDSSVLPDVLIGKYRRVGDTTYVADLSRGQNRVQLHTVVLEDVEADDAGRQGCPGGDLSGTGCGQALVLRSDRRMGAPWQRFVWSCRECPDPAGRRRVKRSAYLRPKGSRGQQHAEEAT